MIRPPGFGRVMFGSAVEGDARTDHDARRTLAELGAPDRWATVSQVHGAEVARADEAGPAGTADALYTTVPGLSVLVATADCVPVAIEGDGFAAVVHAGWRGVVAGVVPATLDVLADAGLEPLRAAVGPAIGPCCYEVGDEVLEALPHVRSTTTAGRSSVDLRRAVAGQLGPLEVWVSDVCTLTDAAYHSHRRNAGPGRQVTVAWV